MVGDRFSPSVILFWLKTSIAASSTRVQYKSPNTILGLIPLGSQTQTILLRNIASVDTNTKFNMGSFIWGLVFLIAGFVCFQLNVVIALILVLLGIANLCNMMSAQLDFVNQAGGRNSIVVSILEKNKLMQLAQEIQARVFADLDTIHHQESMDMAQKQWMTQMNSMNIQQQMLQNQQAQAANAQGYPAAGYPQQAPAAPAAYPQAPAAPAAPAPAAPAYPQAPQPPMPPMPQPPVA